MTHNKTLKIKATELRKLGMSFGKISLRTKVNRSTIVRWVKHIPISIEQQQNNMTKQNKKRSQYCLNLRTQYQLDGIQKAKENNSLHLMGCMLYWGEGFKSRNACGLANTDPQMIKLFIKFLRECFNVKNDKITMSINCYDNNGLTIEEIKTYWLEVTNLDRSCMRKTIVNRKPRSATGKPKNGKHPYGICTIITCDTAIVQSIYGSLQEYAGLPKGFGLNINLD